MVSKVYWWCLYPQQTLCITAHIVKIKAGWGRGGNGSKIHPLFSQLDAYTDISEHTHLPSAGLVLGTKANSFCGECQTTGLFLDIAHSQLVWMHVKCNSREMAGEDAWDTALPARSLWRQAKGGFLKEVKSWTRRLCGERMLKTFFRFTTEGIINMKHPRTGETDPCCQWSKRQCWNKRAKSLLSCKKTMTSNLQASEWN